VRSAVAQALELPVCATPERAVRLLRHPLGI
jgi:hypothetical protein